MIYKSFGVGVKGEIPRLRACTGVVGDTLMRLQMASGPVPLAYLFERLGDPDVVHPEEGNGSTAG